MKKINYIGINLKDNKPIKPDLSNTLVVVSHDFSTLFTASTCVLENKAPSFINV